MSADPLRRAPGRAADLAGLLASAVLPALFWGLLLRSSWAGVTTLAVGLVALSWFRAVRLPLTARISVVFLLGGTLSAVALLTHRALVR
jgi:hypothetical protein